MMKDFFKLVGLITAWFAGFSPVISALVILVLMDIISGLLKAWSQKKMSSQVSRVGMTKKAMTFLIVGAAYVLDNQLGMKTATSIDFSAMVAGFYCVTEIISIVENAKELGLPIPKTLVERITVTQVTTTTTEGQK